MKAALAAVVFMLCAGALWAKPHWMDQLYLYLEHDAFTKKKCDIPTEGIICGANTEKLKLYAETDGKDGYVLYIKERFEPTEPFGLHMLQVAFTHRDGVIITDITDFYEGYPRRKRGAEIPLVQRRWLQDIQKVLKPTYPFPALK